MQPVRPLRLRMRPRRRAGTLVGMAMFRLRAPDRTLDLGEFDNAHEALESAVARDPDRRAVSRQLEVLVGESWHPVEAEGDMP